MRELEGLKEIYNNYDTFIIDLWGVMHNGIMLNPKAIEVVKNLQKMDKNRKYGKAQQLAVSEIMTILILFQITQYRNFKTYYNEFIKVYWREYFPQAPSYNRFVELMSQAILPLSCF